MRQMTKMQPEIAIAGRAIGAQHPPYIVAELSANHGGSLDRALDTLAAAKAAGAEAIKEKTVTAMAARKRPTRTVGGLFIGPLAGRRDRC